MFFEIYNDELNLENDIHAVSLLSEKETVILTVKGEVLTAAKTLIEDGAEQRHIDFYEWHEESNKLFIRYDLKKLSVYG